MNEKVVLITGASGGIGAGMARLFAKHRATVAVHYRTREEGANKVVDDIIAAGGQAKTFYADLRSEKAINRLVVEVIKAFDVIDCLVNNAGIVLKTYLKDTSSELWDDILNINLRAPHLLSQAVLPHLRDGGSVIHNTSIHAKNSVPNFGAYAASKAALESLAQVQALEWAERGIRVNCVAPGVVPVERTTEALQAASKDWLPHIPRGRYGTVEEIAEMTLWLASDRAGWVTGQSFVVDGGMTARIDMPKRDRIAPPPAPDSINEH